MTKPPVTKLELSNCTTEKSVSLNSFMKWKSCFRCHLYLILSMSPLIIKFLSVRIPPYLSSTKNFQKSLAVASDTPSLFRILSSLGSLLITTLSLDSRSRDLSKNETQSTLPGASPYGGHNPLNFPVV